METRYLEEFATFARVGSIKGAARQLFVASSTLSAHISALEAEVGTPLVSHRPSGVRPTAAGRELLRRIPAISRDVTEAIDTCLQTAAHTISLRVASSFSTSHFESLLMETRHDFCNAHPEMTVDLVPVPVSTHGEDSLTSGDADLAMAGNFRSGGAGNCGCRKDDHARPARLPDVAPRCSAVYMYTDPILLLVARGNELFDRPSIFANDLQGTRMLFIGNGGWDVSGRQIMGLLADAGVHVEPVIIDTTNYWDYCYYGDPDVLRIVSEPTVRHYDLDRHADLRAHSVADLPMCCDRFAIYDRESLPDEALPFLDAFEQTCARARLRGHDASRRDRGEAKE